MKNYEILKQRMLRCSVAIAIYLVSLPSTSMSRMGTVSITDVEGVPCFSIPENLETRNGLPFRGMSISEIPSGDSSDLPPTVWRIRPTDFDSLPTLHPRNCIQYGELPDGTTQWIYKPLQLLKVYSVFLQARHDGSSMMGYTGEFCLKPAGSGRTFVQVIPEDRRLGDARLAGCIK